MTMWNIILLSDMRYAPTTVIESVISWLTNPRDAKVDSSNALKKPELNLKEAQWLQSICFSSMLGDSWAYNRYSKLQLWCYRTWICWRWVQMLCFLNWKHYANWEAQGFIWHMNNMSRDIDKYVMTMQQLPPSTDFTIPTTRGEEKSQTLLPHELFSYLYENHRAAFNKMLIPDGEDSWKNFGHNAQRPGACVTSHYTKDSNLIRQFLWLVTVTRYQ